MASAVDHLLTRICSDGISRLVFEAQDRYDIRVLDARVMSVTGREVGQPAQRLLWNFMLIGAPTGEFIVERALDGGLRLPAFPYVASRRWSWSKWPALLSSLRGYVRQAFGVELLVPEPVGTFPLTLTNGSKSHNVEALLWVAQHAGRVRPSAGLTATVTARPEQLDLEHDQQLARAGLAVLAGRPTFPVAELAAAAAEGRRGGLRRAKRAARSLLRLAPQPQRKWIFERLDHLGVGPGSRVLDLACGDDPLASVVRERYKASVAVNDLVWANALEAVRRDPLLEAFNHDVRAFPVTTGFDVVIVKNLLHHLRSAADHQQLYDVLRRIALHVLIVEIADPRRTPVHKWLHEHIYTDDPEVDGHSFLDADALRRIVASLPISSEPEVHEVFTVRGSYLLTHFSFER